MNTTSQIKKIGVLTSGGDSPGMNAAIRAVVRTGTELNLSVYGIRRGYQGMVNGEIEPLETSSVANILQRGGTILKAGRCLEFLNAPTRAKAVEEIKKHDIDGIVCIGGDGSFRGALDLWKEHQLPIVGVPGTIDNDIAGTDLTIGFDTAINTALEAIDRIRDTAASHNRLFIVEVMGRDSGFIATAVGLAGGAEEIFIPENPVSVDQAIQRIQRGMARGKTSSILIAAEGRKPGRAYDLAESIRKKSGFEAKVCVLGHVQRGGSPTAVDRILASRLGSASVHALCQGLSGIMVGQQNNQVVYEPLVDCLSKKKQIGQNLLDLTNTLAK
ncbi:MAG: 6-phosphofructokinase [Bdellovibrionales bacterium]|nr:6-phosphofructokinase [Bdellovibrionales bacterium]